MPQIETYMLRIYRSRAVSGWQWVARLDHLPDGESRRFSDPAALLAYLQALLQAGGRAEPRAGTQAGENPSGKAAEEGGKHEGQ